MMHKLFMVKLLDAIECSLFSFSDPADEENILNWN